MNEHVGDPRSSTNFNTKIYIKNSKVGFEDSKFTAENSEKLNERNVEEKKGKLAVDLGFPRA